MTNIEDKALALLNSVRVERGFDPLPNISRLINFDDEALCRAIEQCEAFRQEVSDAMKEYRKGHGIPNYDRFIIPAPKPYPLMAAMKKAGWNDAYISNAEPSLRAALDALGFEIREKNDDQ